MSNILLDTDVNLASDQALAKNISEQIDKQLPGYTWGISVNSKTGIGKIFCLEFSNKWGYVFKLSDIDHDPSYKLACDGGAEILERLGWRRGRANEDQINGTKMVCGTAIFDYHSAVNCNVPDIVKFAYDKLR